MHRYREFGLLSDRDETLRRAFRDGFRRAGLAFPQFLSALAWYRDHAAPGADEAALTDAFAQFADREGWAAAHRDGAVALWRVIRDQGPQAVMDEEPRPEQDRAVVARADDLLRREPARYWGDPELQEAVFEARERLATTPPVPAAPRGSEADRARVREIEAMLRDRDGQRRYWGDPALRADYADALSRLHGEADGADVTAAAAPGPEAAPDGAAAAPAGAPP